jgi:hypothetical protein
MRIKVNDIEVLSNYEEGDLLTMYDLKRSTDEEKEAAFNHPAVYKFKLDAYTLPSLLLKVIKSMKKNEVCLFSTT